MKVVLCHDQQTQAPQVYWNAPINIEPKVCGRNPSLPDSRCLWEVEAESQNPLILVARPQTANFFTPPPPSLRSEPYLVWKSSLRNQGITSEFEMFQLLILGSCNSTQYNLCRSPNWLKKTGPSGEVKDVFYRLTSISALTLTSDPHNSL